MFTGRGLRKKTRIVAAAALLLSTGVVVAVSGSASAAPLPIPGQAGVVQQQAGTITGVIINNATADAVPRAPFPALVGDSVSVTFSGLQNASGVVPVHAVLPDVHALLSFFCGNAAGLAPVTPLVASDLSTPDGSGLAKHCTPLAVDDTTVPGDATVSGTLDLSALPLNQSCGTGLVLPCTIILADLAQDVVQVLPIANVTATAVAGPAAKFAAGTCNPSGTFDPLTGRGLTPPSGCPSSRPSDALPFTTPTPVVNPVVYGGGGFAPSNNNFAPGSPGTNVTAVSQVLCTDALGGGCIPGSAPAINAINPTVLPVGVSAAGRLGGAIFFPGAVPGDYFLQTTAQHCVFTGAAATPPFTDGCSAIGVPAGIGAMSITQVQYAQVRILGAATVTLTPDTGAPGVTPPGASSNVTGSNFDPRATVTIQVNAFGIPFGAPTTAATDGIGNIVASAGTAITVATSDPASTVSVTDGIHSASAPFTNAPTNCVDIGGVAGTCAAAEVITATVNPGNLQINTDLGGGTADIAPPDQTSIDVADPATWYPIGAESPMAQVVFGDMTGANQTVVVSAAITDLVGSLQASNRIASEDVWWTGAACADYLDAQGFPAMAGQDTPSLGAITPGDDSVQGPNAGGPGDATAPGGSPLADGTATWCTVAPDLTGREGGIWQLDLNLEIAGRPSTAADSYTGILTLTLAPQ